MQLLPKLELRGELPLANPDALRDLRHDMASVASALDTLLNSKHVKLGEPAPEILRLSHEKLIKSIDTVDGWLEAADSK